MNALNSTDALGRATKARRARDFDVLARMLASPIAAERQEAATALGRLRPSPTVVEHLLQVAGRDPAPSVRREAVRAIGAQDQHEEIHCTVLRERLQDADRNVRVYAAEALGRLRCRHAESVNALIERLRDGDPMVRTFAAQALADVQHRSTVPGLLTGASDPDARVFRESVRGLAALVDARDVDEIEAILGRSNVFRRRRLRRLLTSIERP